ncbi:TetR/AcrR family transcriptional regulator [Rhodococcus phenolicus]|uniref:TetR/AcrR family transcriptional regulator n=1 Tax=Rhodococcus phenolicus TaxID=263849 RepID=UPI00082CC381|nr:TetR/AcrR family transcriptional regulator [Rhodococcus phenolicus]
MASPRRRLSPDQRRTELLDIGARLFSQHAYEDVRIEEVAELAGVSRGLMYHYFPTKRDFLAAVVQRESDRLLAVTEPDPALSVHDRIAAGLDAYLDYIESHAQGVLAVNRGAGSADASIRGIVDAELDVQQQRIVDALGPDATDLDFVALAVRGWISFVRSVCIEWLEDPRITAAQLRRLCLDALTGMLAARLR